MLDWFPPGCRARKCSFLMTYEARLASRVIEHGTRDTNNGEAVLLIPDHEMFSVVRRRPLTTQETWEMHVAQRLLRWTTRIHAYEEGRPIPEWAVERPAGEE